MLKQKTSVITASVPDAGSIPAVSIGYLAGVLDADGSFSIVKDGNGFKPQTSISNGCLRMLKWCAHLCGIPHSLCQKKKVKSTHSDNCDLKWTYNRAIQVAELVYPHLLVKAARAQCLIQWRDVVHCNGRYNDEQFILRNALIAKIRKLNTLGMKIKN